MLRLKTKGFELDEVISRGYYNMLSPAPVYCGHVEMPIKKLLAIGIDILRNWKYRFCMLALDLKTSPHPWFDMGET